jgi:hypothetical protein
VEGEPGELGSSSENEKWLTLAELADELCPQYMAMGMSYDEYWHGNYVKLEHYRKAHEVKRDRANYDAWLQGAYVYDAICSASPILHAFAKNGTKPHPYHGKPYAMRQEVEERSTTKEQEGAAKFHAFAAQFNKRFSKPSATERQPNENGGGIDGSNDRSVTD